MNRRFSLVFCIIVTLLLTGCNDRLNLEETTLGFMLGIDLDENNNLVYYLSSPVFNREARKKSEEYSVKTSTFWEARGKIDVMSPGLAVGGKVQVLLLGKQLLQQENWFSLLDVVYRNARFAVNARVVVVDGTVADVIRYYPKDKPRLSLHLTKLIDTANQRNITVKTSLQELHRQMFEKGLTPALTEIKKEKGVEVTGTALLTERGKYAELLSLQESTLLQIIQNKEQGELSLTVAIPEETGGGLPYSNKLTITTSKLKVRIKPSYQDDRFHFDITVGVLFNLTERMFPFNVKKETQKLEQWINEQLQQQYRTLFMKMQRHRIDPVGLGLYARAFEYKAWKQVQDHWGEALADADIRVTVKSEIKSMGPVK